MKNRIALSSILVLTSLALGTEAQTISMRYASAVVAGPVPPTSLNRALGPPDGSYSAFNDPGASATYSGFKCPDAYNMTALENALNVTPLVMGQADFISFEFNGVGGQGFESSMWTFSDSSNTEVKLVVNGGTGDELAIGGLGTTLYGTFFGGQSPHGGQWVYVLFDLTTVDTADPAFQVQVTQGAVGSLNSPDIDFLASFSIDTAGSSPRNGSGSNPTGFVTVTEAVLGSTWDSVVDIATPGASFSILASTLAGPTQGFFLNGTVTGELLCLPPYLPLDISFTGLHSIQVPFTCNLLGTQLSSQAGTVKGGVVTLQNAVDFVIGAY